MTPEGLRATRARGGRLPAKIQLSWFAPLGVCLHARRAWPHVGNAFVGVLLADPDLRYHTTQTAVYGSTDDPRWRDHVVEGKIERIGSGEQLPVKVVLREDGLTWIFNGHHTLVAYLILGRTPLVSLHDPGRGDVLEPPKLVKGSRPVEVRGRSASTGLASLSGRNR